MTLRPISLADANAFVAKHHSHHKPVQGCKFAVSAWDNGRLVGVAIVGRPVARMEDDGVTAELTRVCTDGTTMGVASFLLSRAKRAAQAMGYTRVRTRTLISESGVSLAAAGWKCLGKSGGGSWSRPSRVRVDKHPTEGKLLWEAP